jgi:hypothetical protein
LVKTPHGVHLGYRKRTGVALTNIVKINGMPIDIKTDGGLELIPGSAVDGKRYEWLGEGLKPVAELPVAEVDWTRARKTAPKTMSVIRTMNDGTSDIEKLRRARAYLACIEGAIAGQRGHDRTMRVAGVLIQKFGLTIAQAWPLFLEWNEQCEPPWTEKELLHKLQDAEKNRGNSPLSPV